MKKKNEGKIIFRQWVKMFVVLILLALLAIGLYFVSKSFIPNSTSKKELANYKYNANVNYSVHLIDNKFFNEKILGMNEQYISSLIDYIEFNPRYEFQSNIPMNYNYSYQIVATAKGTYNAEEKPINIWSKSYTILPMVNKKGVGNKIVINETAKIDYNAYNNILLDFKKEFGLSIGAKVDVALKLVINAMGTEDSTIKFNENTDLVLSIPLLNSTTKFETQYSPEGSKSVYEEHSVKSQFDLIYFILGLCLSLLTAFLLVKAIKSLLVATKKSEYVLAFNKIMKNYGDIIAEADNVPDLTRYDIIAINSFADLVDIEEELRHPILCVEIRENRESWFIILNDKSAYRYILKYESIINDIDRDILKRG